MSDQDFDDDIDTNDGCYCPKCGHETSSRACYELGCDDGYHDDFEDDPLWFDPGDISPCSTCHGTGIIRWCPAEGCDWSWRGEKLQTDREIEESARADFEAIQKEQGTNR